MLPNPFIKSDKRFCRVAGGIGLGISVYCLLFHSIFMMQFSGWSWWASLGVYGYLAAAWFFLMKGRVNAYELLKWGALLLLAYIAILLYRFAFLLLVYIVGLKTLLLFIYTLAIVLVMKGIGLPQRLEASLQNAREEITLPDPQES